MRSGAIPQSAIPGPLDLQATLESGQTFRWTRRDGSMYDSAEPSGGEHWYRTLVDGQPVEVRQTDSTLEWRAAADPTAALIERLALTDDMTAMIEALADEGVVGNAKAAYEGLRIVNEPFFPTLVSFILSAQMRIERIHSLVQALSRKYGAAVRTGDLTVHRFPTPEELAAATETELRDLGLGYRAPYVEATAEMVADGELTASDLTGQPYETARRRATEFVGVGEKVADCVLLFSLGYTEPVPLDTWIRTAIDTHYPDVEGSSYDEISRGIRDRLGPDPGVAQTYVFHYLRNEGSP
ncbi:MAG: DNA-3-methyladenine glycosylase [Halanaeroarchaeum sp.]